MTLILSEEDVASLVDMKGAVQSVEEAFLRQGTGGSVNSVRTRSRVKGAQLNAMHAASPYLGRGGVKTYMSTGKGTRFVFILFDMADGTPLAVMGADILGRYRTGAASGVATKYLYGRGSASVVMCGTGRQALTQILALSAVTSVQKVRAWSPRKEHRDTFVAGLVSQGFDASSAESPAEAMKGADVVSTITSSDNPFISSDMLGTVAHLNVCGGNDPERSEVFPDVVGECATVVVDDLAQAKVEYGDLIKAVKAKAFSWDRAVELKQLVNGMKRRDGRTLFKSGGAALEDVALGSQVYDKALKSGRFTDVRLG